MSKREFALSAKARRLRRDKLAALRQEMKQRLSMPRRGRVPMPAPRYDEVFEKGAVWLDTLAGDPAGGRDRPHIPDEEVER